MRTKVGIVVAIVMLACSSAPSAGPADASPPIDSNTSADACACKASAVCCAGACVEGTCGFAVTSATPNKGWLDGGDWVRLTGTGFTPNMQVWFGDARAPVRVESSTSAMTQTPPGALGSVDVRIVSGTTTSTTVGAFSYHKGGFVPPWTQKSMHSVRGRAPGMAVMQDGRVLVAGGVLAGQSNGYDPSSALDTAEIFDVQNQTFSDVTTKMSTPRWFAAAVTLLDGRVLVVGGACWQVLSSCAGDPTRADLFDPKTGTFTPTKSPMNAPRVFPRATLLVDGRVMFTSSNDPSVEIYDPETDSFSVVTPKASHVLGGLARLRDGRVLLATGLGSQGAELFDSDTNTFTLTGSTAIARFWPTMHTLPDGRVFVVGGSLNDYGTWSPVKEIEIYDPKAGTFTTAPYTMTVGRYGHTASLVRDGTIVAIGGYTLPTDCNSVVASVDQIDPVAGTVTPFATIPQATSDLSSVTTLDGSIVVAGGGGCGPAPIAAVDFLAPAAPQ